jgi:Transglutaminase-like superfamily
VITRLALIATCAFAFPACAADQWWDDVVEHALGKAKDNRSVLAKALNTVPKEQRKGMAFLIGNMPDGDLQALKADFLLTNCELAYKARAETPWGKEIPEDIFLNDVLPYANVDESRDAWRKEFYDLCMPIAKTCKTPSEAAQKINGELFKTLKVKYSTERKAPNQSPKESIEQGKASCTGLSIVLSDACRAVCVPARLVGTPLWANKRGNHTWVEIWDKTWHFTGACEPDPSGLDRGWFVGDAAQAKKDSFEHAIYATSFRKTDQHFPLVWALGYKGVPAENVTDRYAKPAPKIATVRVLIRVIDADKKRVATAVTLTGEKSKLEGTSRGPTADLNDMLGFDLTPGTDYVVKAGGFEKKFTAGKVGEQQVVEIVLAK